MPLQTVQPRKSQVTDPTAVRSRTRVGENVARQAVFVRESFSTLATYKGLVARVSALVCSEIVEPRKRTGTLNTQIGSLACMLPDVHCKLIGSLELFPTFTAQKEAGAGHVCSF